MEAFQPIECGRIGSRHGTRPHVVRPHRHRPHRGVDQASQTTRPLAVPAATGGEELGPNARGTAVALCLSMSMTKMLAALLLVWSCTPGGRSGDGDEPAPAGEVDGG